MGGKATTASERRKTEPKRLSALLRGDLDWVVMKALEKDRTRRYATAKDFADDVQHYLTHEPVEARAPSTFYRFQKFTRRYRAVSATIAVIAVTLIAATGFSGWMAVREGRAKQQMQVAMGQAEQERLLAQDEAQKARRAAADAELSLQIIGGVLGADGGIASGPIGRMRTSWASLLSGQPQLARKWRSIGAEKNWKNFPVVG